MSKVLYIVYGYRGVIKLRKVNIIVGCKTGRRNHVGEYLLSETLMIKHSST